jgi:hypothetical protein
VAADVAHQTARAHEAGAPQDEARANAAAHAQPTRAHMRVERQHASRAASPSFPSRAQITRVAAQTATFQLLASIAAPFVVIHTAVGAAKKALASTKAARLGPTLVGLALIPALPIVDHPIEHGAAAARKRTRKACCVVARGVLLTNDDDAPLFCSVLFCLCGRARAAVESAFDAWWPRSAEGAAAAARISAAKSAAEQQHHKQA